ncbi:MAG TPA: sugar phosphate nucleotidyltransferase [Pirellulaceae bacterium]|nr:sugar phosphate nucleotidyltransferase [Pirellulaceae bacterium]
MLHAVIMAGGSGTRFWPLSRMVRPKQLLDLAGGRTMIQATVDRLGNLAPAERTWIITNRSLASAIAEQLPQLARERIVGEPCKRDTAPAVGLSALLVAASDADATLVVMPSDHLIEPAAAFQAALQQAAAMVEERPQTLVTFGIKPTHPAESFGYIERGKASGRREPPDSAAYEVARFREKPARSVAEQYLASGNFYWNSGIFVWKAKTILAALAKFEPAIYERLVAIGAAIGKPDFEPTLDREFTAIRGKSIDFAVMEHYQPVVVIEAPFTWDDVGSWQALARARGVDDAGNTAVGKHLGIRTSGSIIRTTPDHLIVTLGLKDTIVVHTEGATLVADKSQEEAIREVVKALEERGWREFL